MLLRAAGAFADNWQFLTTLMLALAALIIGIRALASSHRVEEAVVGDGPSVLVQWHRAAGQTQCTLRALGEVKNARFKLGKEQRPLPNLGANRTDTIVLPVMESGAPWELHFVDPATGKRLRQKGVVRYD